MMELVDSYLALRRAVGFELKMAEYMLRSFARYASERGESYVRTNTVIDWASQASSVAQRDERLKTVIRFADHLHVEDQRHQVPPRDVFGCRKTRRVPFIYTKKQISSLIEAASGLGPRGTLRPHTYSTLFALLAATGLRISEALKSVHGRCHTGRIDCPQDQVSKDTTCPLPRNCDCGARTLPRS